MATITRSVHNPSASVSVTIFVPGFDTIHAPVVVAPSSTLDLFTVLSAIELQTAQPVIAELVAAGQLSVTATTNPALFSPTGISVLASDPGSPVEGEVWYNTTSHLLKYYDGTTVQTVAHV